MFSNCEKLEKMFEKIRNSNLNELLVQYIDDSFKLNKVRFIYNENDNYEVIDYLENSLLKLNNENAKGKKMNYYEMPKEIRDFYIDDTIRQSVSTILKENVDYADETERYRIFARLYQDDSDFLDWHYDNNFTKGNRYTLVIPILVDSGNKLV
jgi:hypothetical protein